MLVKIKVGTQITVNGVIYTVRGTSLHDCNRAGASRKVSLVMVNYDGDGELNLEFDDWTVAISERDLDGLKELLTTG